MRALVILFQIAAVVGVAYLIVRYSLRRRPAVVAPFAPPAIPAGGRWQARHYADEGHTVVAVARMLDEAVLEEHVVARIPDWDDDWSRKFLAAKEEAEERAFHLNTP